jgi:hypothetical protein
MVVSPMALLKKITGETPVLRVIRSDQGRICGPEFFPGIREDREPPQALINY